MKKNDSVVTKPYPFAYNIFFRAVGVFLLLTMLSVWLVCGLFAKYTVSDSGSDSAIVAAVGEIAMFEHKAVYNNGIYTLDSEKAVSSNEYKTVLPGTEIPKDPYIILTGKNDVSCSLYIEIVNSENIPAAVQYEIDSSNWIKVSSADNFSPVHGGTLYEYKETISPHTSTEIKDIIEGNRIAVSDTLKDKTDPDQNSDPFSIDFYAYLIQND